MNVRLASVLLCLALPLTGCGFFQKAPSAGTAPKTTQNVAPASNQGLQVIDRVTEPTLRTHESILSLSTPEGIHAAIDLRQLVDVDNGFKPVGDDPDQEENARVLSAAIKCLFHMGLYDTRRTSLRQADVDAVLAKVKFSKPIWIEYASKPGFYLIDTAVFYGDRMLGVVAITQHEDGTLHGSDAELASGLEGLPSVPSILPALPKSAAYRALSLNVSGFGIQSVDAAKLKRIKIRSRVAMAGDLEYCWQAGASSQPYVVGSTGVIYRYQLPRGIQSFSSLGDERAMMTKVGTVTAVASDFAGLK